MFKLHLQNLLPKGYVTTIFSEQSAAAVAAALCVVCMVIVLFLVPNSTKDPAKLAHSKDNYSEPTIEREREGERWCFLP